MRPLPAPAAGAVEREEATHAEVMFALSHNADAEFDPVADQVSSRTVQRVATLITLT